ncbi:MAG: hypothetical protein MPJ50_10615 [Pirellulales bacterium]|nr:hypothetical protein [Pirellulales bacterium]
MSQKESALGEELDVSAALPKMLFLCGRLPCDRRRFRDNFDFGHARSEQ